MEHRIKSYTRVLLFVVAGLVLSDRPEKQQGVKTISRLLDTIRGRPARKYRYKKVQGTAAS